MTSSQQDKFLYIAEEGLKAKLPAEWKAVQKPKGEMYYINDRTKICQWDHPIDNVCREKLKAALKEEKEK